MNHFLYLVGFAVFVSAAFAVFKDGDAKECVIYGIKLFFQFIGISLAIAWLLYFIPW
ncbi:MAG: hypothetical protein KF855_10640 [Acidobacteria bacterium]|nr:hypothetical protein [Acidobacteriota bacterium]